MSIDNAKRAAAAKALELVQDDMVLGLGTGSTAAHFIDLLGEKVKNGLTVTGIPTSQATREQALRMGIDLIDPDETTKVDLAIDGTDEVDPALSLIKGGGGALLREKIIARAAREFVIIADESKKVKTLGAFALPVEIEPFGWALSVQEIRRLLSSMGFDGHKVGLRGAPSGGVFHSDGGNYILDCALEHIEDSQKLDQALRELPGVIETGLFIGMTKRVYIAQPSGGVEVMRV